MRQKTGPQTSAAEKTIKDIRRATRKHHSSEEKIRIVLEGLRGEDSICQRRSKNRPRGGAKVGHCGAGLRPPGGLKPERGSQAGAAIF